MRFCAVRAPGPAQRHADRRLGDRMTNQSAVSAGGAPSSEENFAALFAASLKERDIVEGRVVKGTVIAIENDMALIDIGLKAEGRVAVKEFGEDGRPPEIKVGDEVEIVGLRDTTKTVCTGVEMFNKTLDEGIAGDNVGCLLRGVKRDEIERGQVLAKPGSITPHTKFECEVYVLKKAEGGRHTPFFPGYKPQFYFRTTDVTGDVKLIGAEMIMPGDNAKMEVQLIQPIAMEEQLRFAIREGSRTIGAGVVTKVIE